MTKVSAIILGGGFGTRLRSVVADRPKVLAEVAGRPFLDYLLDQLVAARVDEVILSTGFMADVIESHYGGSYRGLPLRFAREESPLGTGGAIKLAASKATSDTLLVMNGDSYVDMSLCSVLHFHTQQQSDGTFVLVRVSDTARFGSVEIDGDDLRIKAFREKSASSGSGLINGGIYVLQRSMLDRVPNGQVSFERELAPEWISSKTILGFQATCKFIDIGIPESYEESHEILGGLTRA